MSRIRRRTLLIYLIIMIISVLLTTSGCAGASSQQRQNMYKELDETVARNDFQASLQQLILAQAANRPLYNNNNVISLYIDKGLLEHYGGLYRDSSTSLQDAERLIQEAYTRSLTQSVATYIINDNTREYPGEDFEDIYISVFNALNHYKLNDIDGALVEVRKLTLPSGKLELLSRKYDQGNQKIRGEHGAAIDQVQNSDGASEIVTKPTSFSNSALARYLSVLFYQADRNYDSARIELEQLRLAFAQQPGIYNFAVPNAIQNIENTPLGEARLDILTFVGLSPIKEEEILTQFFPIFQDRMLRNPQFSLPKLVDRPNRIDRIEVVVNGERHNLELLENMGAVITDTFNARYTNIFLKTYIRTLLKYTAADVASREVQKRSGGGLGGALVNATASAALRAGVDASENADIRMARFLPNKAYIGSINLEPGTYNVTMNFYSGRNLVRSKTREDVVVRANNLNLAQFVNLDFIYAIGEVES